MLSGFVAKAFGHSDKTVSSVSRAYKIVSLIPVYFVCRDFYDIDSLLSPTCLLTRCNEGKKKNIYFTSLAVRDIVINNHLTLKVSQYVLVNIYTICECFF